MKQMFLTLLLGFFLMPSIVNAKPVTIECIIGDPKKRRESLNFGTPFGASYIVDIDDDEVVHSHDGKSWEVKASYSPSEIIYTIKDVERFRINRVNLELIREALKGGKVSLAYHGTCEVAKKKF